MDEEAKRASSNAKNDFSEYMWMADLENFDREVCSEIEEEDYIRSSIELLLDEEEKGTVYFGVENPSYPQNCNGYYMNGPQGQYDQGAYGTENLEQDMGNIDLSQFNQQSPYLSYPQQAIINQQGANEWNVYPQNEMLPQRPRENRAGQSVYYHQNKAQQNGYHPNGYHQNVYHGNGYVESIRRVDRQKNQLPTVNVSIYIVKS